MQVTSARLLDPQLWRAGLTTRSPLVSLSAHRRGSTETGKFLTAIMAVRIRALSQAGRCVAADGDIYRSMTNSQTIDLYGVLGHPVAHSLSPFIMNRAFRQARIDAD